MQNERIHLAERNKELGCLYEIAKIVADPEKTMGEVLTAVAAVLPPAFRYPDRACARIRLDELSFHSPYFIESGLSIIEVLVIAGQQRGAIEVHYRDEAADGVRLVFLPEERRLLQTIARQSALMIETKLANERKLELENQLRHADRLAKIGQLTSGMAHELNEPLAGILGFAQLAIKKLDSPETARRYLDRIVGSCLQAREIIRKMMQFGSPSAPKMEKMDLNHLVEESIAFIAPRFSDAGVEFHCNLSPLPPMMDGDASQLTQVLANLIINAIHAMPDGGAITITTSVAQNRVQLRVADTGIGMDAQTMEQIFLPFFTTKDVDQGTGLGLSVVHGIVAAHGGTIDVASRRGDGAAFTITFPIHEGQGGAES